MKLDRVIAVRNRKTVFRDGENCIKVFDSGYTKADVLSEALNQARIEETGLNIPEVLEIIKVDGRWAIVSKFIEGKTLERLMTEYPEKRKDWIQLFTGLHTEIHQKRCPELSRQKDLMNMELAQCSLDATTRYALHTRLETLPRTNHICHGDFSPSNIIINENDGAYILDWTHATQGNPAADAARTYLLFWLEGRISGAEEYLDLFTGMTGETRENVERWMPIVAAARSVRGNEKEREFLLSWVEKARNHE